MATWQATLPATQVRSEGPPLITDEAASEFGFTKGEIEEALNRFTSDALLWKLVVLIGRLETGGRDPFSAVFGDFNGFGISFGIGWWSLRLGTLQPILKQMRAANPTRFDTIMGGDREFVVAWLDEPSERGLEIARTRILHNSRSAEVPDPWKSRFTALGSISEFQRIQLAAMRPRLDRALIQTTDLGLRSERALAFVYDFNFARGPLRPQEIAQDQEDQRAFARAIGRSPDEQERLLILTNRAVLRVILPELRPKVRARHLLFALGKGKLGITEFDLEQAGFGMRDLASGVPIRTVDDPKSLQRLQSGWIPGEPTR